MLILTLKQQYKKELKRLKNRIQDLSSRGYIYEYKIKEHQSIKPSTIKYLKSLKGKKLIEGVKSSNIEITVVEVGKGNVPTRREQREAGLSIEDYASMLQQGVNPYELKDITQSRISSVADDREYFESIKAQAEADKAYRKRIEQQELNQLKLYKDPAKFYAEQQEILQNPLSLEEGTYLKDTYTGTIYDLKDPRIYKRDSHGRFILDENGNKVLKANLAFVSQEVMNKKAYEELIWDNTKSRYYYANSPISQKFLEWLELRRQEFGTFGLRKAILEYEARKDVYLDYRFFYKATDEDLRVVQGEITRIVMRYGDKKLTDEDRQELIQSMDDLESFESWEEPD